MENKINILKKSKLFSNIDNQELISVLTCLNAKVARYSKGSYVFAEGEIIDKIGIVIEGELHIIKTDYYGRENIIASVTCGNVFAESAACSSARRLPVDVIANTGTEIVFIDYKRMVTTCAKTCSYHTLLINNMISVIADKNVMLNTKLDYLSKRLTKEKVLAYLYDQSKKNRSKVFRIPFNREQLANYLSVDRSAMSNELSKLAADKIIRYKKNEFELL